MANLHRSRSVAILVPILLSVTACVQSQNKKLPAGSAGTYLPITVDSKSLPGEYVRTQGQTLNDLAAPYVEEYSKINAIDLPRLAAILFPKGLPKPPLSDQRSVLISSYDYRTSDWSYFKSAAVCLYEVSKVRGLERQDPMFLVLYNRAAPAAIIIDHFVAEWRLALVSSDYRLLSDLPFATSIRHHAPGLWDMIYTGLTVENSSPVVRIMYSHTGGGGGRDQEFTFRFAVDREALRLKLLESKQTLDAYDE